MACEGLTAFWIKSPLPHGPFGFGVTAWSLEDALSLIRAFDYGRYLPENQADIHVTGRHWRFRVGKSIRG